MIIQGIGNIVIMMAIAIIDTPICNMFHFNTPLSYMVFWCIGTIVCCALFNIYFNNIFYNEN